MGKVYGRDDELSKLQAFESSDKKVYLLGGESGIGKSYLLKEFFEKSKIPFKVLVKPPEYHETGKEIFNLALLGIIDTYKDDLDGLEDKVTRVLKGLGTDMAKAIFQDISTLLKGSVKMSLGFVPGEKVMGLIRKGYEEATSGSDVDKLRKQLKFEHHAYFATFWEMASTLTGNSKLLIIFDQFEDSGLKELFVEFCDTIPENVKIVVGVNNDAAVNESNRELWNYLTDKILCERLVLQPLKTGDVKKWVYDVKGDEIADIEFELIEKKTGNNPLIIDGWLTSDIDLSELKGGKLEILKKMYRKKADTLGDGDTKRALRFFSLLRKRWPESEMLSEYLQLPPGGYTNVSSNLVRAGFFDDNSIWFKHDLLKIALRETIPPRLRVEENKRIAKFLNGKGILPVDQLFHLYHSASGEEKVNVPKAMVYLTYELQKKEHLADAEELYLEALNLGYVNKALVFNNLGLVYRTWGRLDDALDLFRRALKINKELGRKEGMADQYVNLGIVCKTKGDLDKALKYYDKALKIDKELGSKEGMASDYGNIGNVYNIKGDLDKTLEYHNKSLNISKELGCNEVMAIQYGNIGNVYKTKGDLNHALEHYKKSLEIEKELGRKVGMANQYGNIGIVYKIKGDLDHALEYFNKSLKINKKLDRKEGMATNYLNIGNVYQTKGDLDRTLEYYDKSLKIDKELGRKGGMASDYGNIGNVYLTKRDLDNALEHFNKSLEINEELGSKEGIASQCCNIGIVYDIKGDFDRALEHYDKSLELNKELGRKEGMATDYLNIGIVYGKKGDLDRALEYFSKSMEINKELGSKEGMANQYGNIGTVYQKKGDLSRVIENYEKSLDIFKELGAETQIMKVESLLDEIKKEEES